MPRKGVVQDITIHMRRKDGRKATADQARKAFWAAQEIARRGGDIAKEMREWELVAIDWRHTPGKEYRYDQGTPSKPQEVLENLIGIIRTVGMSGLTVRIGRPE